MTLTGQETHELQSSGRWGPLFCFGGLVEKKTLFKILFLLVCVGLVTFPVLRKIKTDGARVSEKTQGQLSRVDEPVPTPVPYLDSKPSPVDGQGRAEVRPAGPFTVGQTGNFVITYTVGDAGVRPGGFVLLQVSPWWGWSPPQTVLSDRPGYTEVETSFSGPALNVSTLEMNRILVTSPDRGFRPGETITFRYGGHARVDRFAEDEELFQVFVDADGDGHSACIEAPPTVRIVAAPPATLHVTVPSQSVPGEKAEVRLAPLDLRGNWGVLPGGVYSVRVTRNGEPVETLKREIRGGESTLSLFFVVQGEGAYFFEAEGPGKILGRSNVLLCRKEAPYLKLYFGDIHGHSRLSDGTGTPEAFYRYAREVSGLNIAALTDHCDFGTVPVGGKVWDRIVKAASEAYVPGTFVTFLGFEWTNWTYGHRNVYYRDGQGPVFRSMDPGSDTPEELWTCLEPYEAMTVAHHVGGGPVATDWDVIPGPREWLVEVCSIHGSSESYLGEASVRSPVKGAFVRDALARGYRLGMIGSGDTHDGHPGQRSEGAVTGGLLGVYSAQLTREAVWEAFRDRHVYATSGPKIILNFRVADAPMGSEVTRSAADGKVPIAIRAVGCDLITMVEVFRDGEPLARWTGEEIVVRFFHEDPMPATGVHWYYVRVTQRDRNMAWSSPVWVDVE